MLCAHFAEAIPLRRIKFWLVAVIVCGILLAANGLLLQRVGSSLISDQVKAELIGHKLLKLRQLHEGVLDMEASQRGYLLTVDASHLLRFQQGESEARGALDELRTLYANDGKGLEKVDAIVTAFVEASAEFGRTIELCQAGRKDDAVSLAMSHRSKRTMNGMRSTSGELRHLESTARAVLIKRTPGYVMTLYTAAGASIFLVLVLVTGALGSTAFALKQLRNQSLAFEQAAMHDVLTALPNRRYLDEWCGQALEEARRCQFELHFLYVDLNGFKQINDRLGHAVGDKILVQAAQSMRKAIRLTDFVARIGGDEFVIVVPDRAFDEPSRQVAERLEVALGRQNIFASIGIASYPKVGRTTAELLLEADKQMYHAKKSRMPNSLPTTVAA